MIYVVLGMHKSGTTLVSELLHKSGINMVDSYQESLDYKSGNQIERTSTLSLNQKILQSDGVHSLHIPFEKTIELIPDHQKQMIEIIENCQSKYGDWGFKDPRSCITYPLWKENLPEHKLIIVYRHPVQVMNHYSGKIRWGRTKAYFGWSAHNQRILDILEVNKFPALIINYEDLMTGSNTVKQLEDFIEKPVFDARKLNNYNHKSTKSGHFTMLNFLSKNKALNIYKSLRQQHN